MKQKQIVIIGGVAGGATAASRIRRLNEHAEITIFEQGEYISFANCGLPYYISGEIESRDNLLLQTPEGFKKRYNVDVNVLSKVIKIDKENKKVLVRNQRNDEEYYKDYDELILSMGAKPRELFEDVYTVRNIPDIEKIKENIKDAKSAIIIGGGYIGLEIAENLSKLEIDITIVQRSSHVIENIDEEMAGFVHKYLNKKGIKLLLNSEVKSVEKGNVVLENNNVLNADIVISAIGITPDIKIVKEAGIKIGTLGGVVVNEYMETSEKNIYAVGDMVEVSNFVTKSNSLIALASPANKQARIVADNICGIKSKYNGTQGTSIIRIFDMAVAVTGANEELLKLKNIPYLKSYTHSFSNATYFPGARQMSIKLLWSKETDKLLGAQIIGYTGVDKRIDVLATGVRFELTPQNLAELELAYAPPFSSAKDPINIAGYVASNIIEGKEEVFYIEDIEKLDDKKDILIDVRSSYEYKEGTIENSINIPIDLLRQSLDRIPKDKNIYLFCQVGQRGYLASRILKQNGFENVKNLSGGYRTYTGAK